MYIQFWPKNVKGRGRRPRHRCLTQERMQQVRTEKRWTEHI
jgi:hypothetical protein